MIRLAATNLLTHATNGRYVLWDNGDDPEVAKFCQKLVTENDNPSVQVIYHKSMNIGLNAINHILQLYGAGCDFHMNIDEDILFLPMGFQSILQDMLTQTDKPIGYVGCNVFQDGLTNGARPGLEQYRRDEIGGRRVLFGPTGGWATMTTFDLLKKLGGFPQHKELFFGLDGMYSAQLHKMGIETGIAEDVLCYHATGAHWNDYFNYRKIYDAKLAAYNTSKE